MAFMKLGHHKFMHFIYDRHATCGSPMEINRDIHITYTHMFSQFLLNAQMQETFDVCHSCSQINQTPKKLQCVGVAEQIVEAVEPPYEPHRFVIREVHEVLINAVRTPINDV